MKLVVTDIGGIDIGDLNWKEFEEFGSFEKYSDLTDEDNMIRRIGDAEIVINNKNKITKRILDSCKNIKAIVQIATGYDNVDIEYAAKLGIPVYNAAGYATRSVAQFTIALILELCHHVGVHNDSVMAGDWCKSVDFCYWLTPQTELFGKTLGIIGYGQIGKSVAEIAKAMGMNVIAYSPHYAEGVSLNELYEKADIISLNCRATAENKGFICRESISRMKDGVWIVNTARGAIINEQDMSDALNSGKVGAYAADVVAHEPMLPDNPLLGAKNCVITPHIAWCSKECRQRDLDITAENIRSFLRGSSKNRVN